MKVAILVLSVATIQAQSLNPLSDDVRRAYADVRNNILRSAERMPAESFDFRPAEQYLYFCGPLRGEQKAVDVERTKTTKAELLVALKDSFAYCDSAYNETTDVSAKEIVNTGGNRSMKLLLLWMNVVHDQSHYGNIVTYLRMKGIVPPSTEGQ